MGGGRRLAALGPLGASVPWRPHLGLAGLVSVPPSLALSLSLQPSSISLALCLSVSPSVSASLLLSGPRPPAPASGSPARPLGLGLAPGRSVGGRGRPRPMGAEERVLRPGGGRECEPGPRERPGGPLPTPRNLKLHY